MILMGYRILVVFVAALMAAMLAMAVVSISSAKSEEADAALVTVETCDGGTIELNATEKQVLDLHNRVRADNGLPPLCVHAGLTEAARAHSEDLLKRDYFSHTSLSGETFSDRLERFGYTSNAMGENIAWGSSSLGEPKSIFEGWMNSPEHRDNILDGSFRQIGIGAHTGTYETYGGATVYTVDFGGSSNADNSDGSTVPSSEAAPPSEVPSLDNGTLFEQEDALEPDVRKLLRGLLGGVL